MTLLELIKPELLDCFGHESWASLTPSQTRRVLALANVPGILHNLTASRGFDNTARNNFSASVVYLRRENMVVSKIKRPQTNDVCISPPAAAFEQQFVAKEVCKPGVARRVLVAKDARRRHYLARIHNNRSCGDVLHIIVNVEMIIVAVADKRRDRQLLHH